MSYSYDAHKVPVASTIPTKERSCNRCGEPFQSVNGLRTCDKCTNKKPKISKRMEMGAKRHGKATQGLVGDP